MTKDETLKYLIKYYNLKRLRDWKKERWDKSNKNNEIIENLQKIRKDLKEYDSTRNTKHDTNGK